MAGMTDCITEQRWEDVWTTWFCLVDDAYQTLERVYGGWRQRGPRPQLHDSEVITIAFIIDTWFHGHEALGLSFLRQYAPTCFPHLPTPGHFNARRTILGPLMDQIRRLLTNDSDRIPSDMPYRLIDSLPIPLATYRRSRSTNTVAGTAYYSVMPTRSAKLFGLRMTVTITPDGVIDDWCVAPAAIHDSQIYPEVLADAPGRIVFGDGAYHNPHQDARLAEQRHVQVFAPPRRDAKSVTPWALDVRQQFSRIRQRVETVFRIVTTVFDIARPRARSLKGVISRISTRTLAYTLCLLTPALEGPESVIKTPN